MKQSGFEIDEIKEKLIYYVLSTLRTESDPSDDRLKEIISEVIGIDKSTSELDLSEKRSLAQAGDRDIKTNGQRQKTDALRRQ